MQTANGKKATCTVNVNAIMPTGVAISKSSATLDIGGELDLTATVTPTLATNKTVTWTSSDTSVATVDANGHVVAIKAGSATITATTVVESIQATCAITVNDPAEEDDSSTQTEEYAAMRAFNIEVSQYFATLLNAEREANGLSALDVDTGALMDMAMIRAEELNVLFSHERPDAPKLTGGVSCVEGYFRLGENIAQGRSTLNISAESYAERYFEAWKSSEGHYATMMKDNSNAFSVAGNNIYCVFICGSYDEYKTTEELPIP